MIIIHSLSDIEGEVFFLVATVLSDALSDAENENPTHII